MVILSEGRMGFVEVKAPRQTPRPLQVARHRRLAELGCYVAVLDNPAKVDAVLDEIEQHTLGTTRQSPTAVTERSGSAVAEQSHSRMSVREGGDDHAKPG